MPVQFTFDTSKVEHPLPQIFGKNGNIDNLERLLASMQTMSHDDQVATLGLPENRGLLTALSTAYYAQMTEQVQELRELTGSTLHDPKLKSQPGYLAGLGFIPLHHFPKILDGFTAHSPLSPDKAAEVEREAERIVDEHPEGFSCYAFLQYRKMKLPETGDDLHTSGLHMVLYLVSNDGTLVKKYDGIHHPVTLVPNDAEAPQNVSDCFSNPVNTKPLEAVTSFQQMMDRDNDARVGRPSLVLMGGPTTPDHRHIMQAINRRKWLTAGTVKLGITRTEAIELVALALFGEAELEEGHISTLGRHQMAANCVNMFGGVFDKTATAFCRPLSTVLASIIDRGNSWYLAKDDEVDFEDFLDQAARSKAFVEVPKDQLASTIQALFDSKALGVCLSETVSCHMQSFELPARTIAGHDDLYASLIGVEIEAVRRIKAFWKSKTGSDFVNYAKVRIESELSLPGNPSKNINTAFSDMASPDQLSSGNAPSGTDDYDALLRSFLQRAEESRNLLA